MSNSRGEQRRSKGFAKRRVLYIGGGAGAVLVIAFVLLLVTRPGSDGEVISPVRGAIEQTIRFSGNVATQDELDLSFERSGTVARVYFDEGDRVFAGDILASLETSALDASIAEVDAQVTVEEAVLAELLRGTRTQELAVQQTKIDNAQRTIEQLEIQKGAKLAQDDAAIVQALREAISESQEGVSAAKNALLTLSDVQSEYFDDSAQDSVSLAKAKALAVDALLDQPNAGNWKKEFISTLTGGIFGDIQTIALGSNPESIEAALPDVLTALQLTFNALNAVPFDADVTDADITSINNEKTAITSQLSIISSKQQAITAERADRLVTMAEFDKSIGDAQNLKALEQQQLALLEAGATSEEIAAQRARIESSKQRRSQLLVDREKSLLRAPIDGIIARQFIDTGETVAQSADVIQLVSEQQEIVANVSELDVAFLTAGQSIDISLDAFGEQVFEGSVKIIKPVETLINNIPSYEVHVGFDEAIPNIRQGMSAEILAMTTSRTNVLLIPITAIDFARTPPIVYHVSGTGDTIENIEFIDITLGERSGDMIEVLTPAITENTRLLADFEEYYN